MNDNMTGYGLFRSWFDFTSNNPHLIKPVHTALFSYIVELWNKLGQKKSFGVPTYFTMDNIGIKSRKTYYNTLSEIEDFGFIKMVEKSKNQNSANIISLIGCVKNTPTNTLAPALADAQANTQAPAQTWLHIDKLLNNKTIKLIEENSELINKKLKSWIDNEGKDEKAIPSLQEVESFAIEFALKHKKDKEQCLFLATKGYNNYLENDWKDVKGSPIKNWKTKLQNSYISLDKLKDAVDEEKLQYDKSFTWLLQGNRVFEDLEYCLMAYNSGQARPTEKMHLENVLKYNKMI